jgi:hypothetical protein
MGASVMVNLSLTNNEWYALHVHIENLLKQYPDNRYLNSIILKLAENCPTIQSIKEDSFIKEYTSQWTNVNDCLSFLKSKNMICENQCICIHMNNKTCPKYEYLKKCYPDDERLKSVERGE